MDSEKLKLSDVPGIDASEDQLFDFACSLNGYEAAGGFEECANISGSPNRNSIDELRIAMFFHVRAARHSGDDFDDQDLNLFRDYTARIREILIERGAVQIE